MKNWYNFIAIIIALFTSTAHAQDRGAWEHKKEILSIGKSGPSQSEEDGAIIVYSALAQKNEHITIHAHTFGLPITSTKDTNRYVGIIVTKNKKTYRSSDKSGTIKIKVIQNTYPPTYKISVSATLQSSEGEEIKIRKTITTTPTVTCQDDQKFSETNAGNTIPNFCLRIAGLTP